MDTRLLLVEHPIDENLFEEVGKALAGGSVVAFPTETVYGLGASAILPDSVREIFHLKGRPADNPLIVHLLSDKELDGVVSSIPEIFYVLYEAFSPGPLTYVMPRGERIPDEVTAGLDTVAVRFPSQPTARALLAAAKVPVVAPSANVSGRPSPTRARHVIDDFAGRIPWIIDDGPCEVGLESTVIDLTCQPVKILRPGVVTAEAIYEKTGVETVFWKDVALDRVVERPVSPGMKYRHYAPKAKVRVVLPEAPHSLADQLIEMMDEQDNSTGLFLSGSSWDELRRKADVLPSQLHVYTYEGESDLAKASHHLFDALRTLDEQGVDMIYAEGFAGEDAVAYMDRLAHAAAATDDCGEREVRRVLFVCHGNTCRSPMAEALFNDRYRDTRWQASSAGLSTFPGWPVSEHTVEVLREFGIDASGMTSKPVNRKMLGEVNVVITMTTFQRVSLQLANPGLQHKIISMADVSERSSDISDPFGETIVSYRRVRDELNDLLDDIYRYLQGLDR
ncbi:MAG TPA: threonylcarbamoyl-AMP synthase [Clostridiaceae bacterium]|nr:threonylcarbamoyl-AMP synthase [Clostridiaceae bacterium]